MRIGMGTGLCGILVAFAAWPGVASASGLLADRDARGVTIKVDRAGRALVEYLREDGLSRHVVVWGAIGARAPDPSVEQVRFRFDYSGGWKAFGRQIWRTFRDDCLPYDGPPLPLLVAACKAPDGTYWALQSWRRLEAMRGFPPFRPQHTRVELHVSHWTGPLALLEVWPNWTYGGGLQGFFGRLTYQGLPVYGFRTPSPTRNDAYARHVYIDTYNSVYGPGWKRDTAIVTHKLTGTFCYTFVPQAPPPGYPSAEPRGPGLGERHRITAIGPGVTPVIQWEGPRLGPYDPVEDAKTNAVFDQVMAGDRVCAVER